MHRPGMLSIWFFIGVLLLAYGILILGAGLYEFASPPPPEHRVVLSDLHAGVWWGVLLILMGIVYSVKFRPGKGNS